MARRGRAIRLRAEIGNGLTFVNEEFRRRVQSAYNESETTEEDKRCALTRS